MIRLLVALLAVATLRAAPRPHVLWLTLEDTSPHFIGCYGNDSARTPNIDRLAGRGIRFTRAFANAPVCSSARTTIITGTLNDALGTGNHRSAFPMPERMKGFPTFLREAGYATFNHKKTDYSTSSSPRLVRESWDESSGQAGWWTRDDPRPFFAVFNFESCHQSRTMTEPRAWYEKQVLAKLRPDERIGDDAFPLPPFLPDTPAIRHEFARVYNSITLADKELGRVLDRLERDGLADDTIVFCYADHGEAMPRGKANPIALGYQVPFIVAFPEKWQHLNPWGEAGGTTDELVCFDDLGPTMLSLVGKPPAPWMTGRPLLGEHRQPPPRHVFGSRHRIDETAGCARSVTDGRYLYTRRFLPTPEMAPMKYFDVSRIARELRSAAAAGTLGADQASMLEPGLHEVLYDLSNDRWEMHNLAGAPEFEPIRKALREKLFEHILATGDVMLLPEFELERISREGTPYDYGQAMPRARRQAILEAADLASRPTADPRLRGLLASDDPVVSYWGATGLRLHPGLLPADLELGEVSYPPARLEVAAARYALGDDPGARRVIEGFARGPDPHLRLQALQRIQDFGDRATAFEETLRSCLKGGTYDTRCSAEVTLHRLGLGELRYGP